MPAKVEESKLQDGTMIRHRASGYEGRIDGITEIRACFTVGGKALGNGSSKHTFQYRIVVSGEPMRRIAPAEDFEILDGVIAVACPVCHGSFQSKPGFVGKPGGRCQCGEWICPKCLYCQAPDADRAAKSTCLNQRKRLVRKLAAEKKGNLG
jgi:hypothetical protein